MAQHAAPLQRQIFVGRVCSGQGSCGTSLERSAQGFEPAIEARLYGGNGNAEDAGHFFDLQFFLEAQDEDFAIDGGNFSQGGLNIFRGLLRKDLVERGKIFFVGELERMLLLGIGEGVEALRFSGALPINDQVAGDGEEPGLEFGFAVVLVAAFEDADPGFLEKIFGALFVAGDVDEVAEQAVLILLDQAVEQVGVAALQAAGDGFGFIGH